MGVKQLGWIGVDLDGTLAVYEGFQGLNHIGAPIPDMVERVKKWLAQGREVRIMTARVSQSVYRPTPDEVFRTICAIQDWCEHNIGQRLKVTCIKDYEMDELWDDRAVQVVPNTGRRADAARDYQGLVWAWTANKGLSNAQVIAVFKFADSLTQG